MKALICGDRDWDNYELIYQVIFTLAENGVDTIIEGEAKGADKISRWCAEELELWVEPFPANWKRYSLGAGPIRNQQMLDEKPDLVVGFHNDIYESKGTLDMLNRSTNAGVPTILVTEASAQWFSTKKNELGENIV